MRKLQRGMKGEDVRLLHAVLNWHLPPPSDQLPTSGGGAYDFGPRTEAKVKEFQKINKIDIGTKDYMDGIVGPHTQRVLESGAKVVLRSYIEKTEAPPVKPRPPVGPLPNPLPKPSLLPPPAPQPALIPAPKLHLDNIQIQAGGNYTWNNGSADTSSVYFQIGYTFLWQRNGPHTEIQVGSSHLFSVNSRKEGNDIQLFGQISYAQIPIWDKLSVTLFGQIAAQSLLPQNGKLKPALGLGAGAQIQWEFIEDTLSIGAQGMPFLNYSYDDDSRTYGWKPGVQGVGFLQLQFDVSKKPGK